MTMQPGSDQYPGVTPLQVVIAFATLPADNAYSCGEIDVAGMGRVTLLGQYTIELAPPNGGPVWLGEGVNLTVWLSPYSLDSQVPAGEAEWWPVSVIQLGPMTTGCEVNLPTIETSLITYCYVSADPQEGDPTLETFTLDISLPTHAARLRVCAAETMTGEGSGPGVFGCYALLSLDPGGEFGWTMKQPNPAVSIVGSVQLVEPVTVDGAVTVTGTVSVNEPVTVDGTVTVNGTVSVTEPVTVDGAVTVSGTVTALDGGLAAAISRLYTANADFSTARDVTAAPTAGQKIVLTDLVVSMVTACLVTVQMETSGNILAGFYLPANGSFQFTLRGMLKGDAADKKLQILSSVASAGAVTAVWYSEA